MIFPNEIKAGLSFEARVLCAAYPAPDWTVTALFRGAGSLNVTASPDGVSHVFLVGADITTHWPAGNYAYAIRAVKDTHTVEIESGSLTITPDLASLSAGHDSRDHVRKVLEAIEATLERRATTDQQKYTIESGQSRREIWRVPVVELLKLRDVYKAELRRMNAQKNGNLFNTAVKMRFSRV